MIRIKLSDTFPSWPLERQTPGGDGIWGDCVFLRNQPVDECDWWVVCDELLSCDSTRCPPEHLIFIGGEPASVKSYDTAFLAQFATVITSQRDLTHPDLRFSQQALAWHIGVSRAPDADSNIYKTYADFAAASPQKTKLMSVICSNQTMTAGHRQRIAFVQALKRHFGDRLDVFGRGVNEIADKWDAIAPYKYHLTIENSSFPDYWTEKLSDTFLGQAFPFYAGCPNLSDYFSRDAYLPLDVTNVPAAIKLIEAAIEARRYEQSVMALRESRDRVLNKYNLFPMISALSRNPAASRRQLVELKPSSAFARRSWKSVSKRLLRGARARLSCF